MPARCMTTHRWLLGHQLHIPGSWSESYQPELPNLLQLIDLDRFGILLHDLPFARSDSALCEHSGCSSSDDRWRAKTEARFMLGVSEYYCMLYDILNIYSRCILHAIASHCCVSLYFKRGCLNFAWSLGCGCLISPPFRCVAHFAPG
jgi:hypothetical protein